MAPVVSGYRTLLSLVVLYCLLLTGCLIKSVQAFERAPSSTSSASVSTKMAANPVALEKGLYIRTPLIKSAPLSKLTGRDVYIKLDCLQPSGSFKDRGMANLCQTLQATKGTKKLIASSGGNAGLAVATVAPNLGMTLSVVVPESTKPIVIERLKGLGAEVTIHGKIWNEADSLARKRVDEDPQAEYVSPYDNPLLWTGHSTIVDEAIEDMPSDKIGAIILSVGGGGLLCGVLEGLGRHGLKSKVVACETEGAACFNKSWSKSPPSPVRLETISSIATSLGALEVTEVAIERSLKHQEKGGKVEAAMCTDKEVVEACLQFSSDHRILVEPACGAGLAALYSDRLREKTLEGVDGPIVVEVCGGSGVNMKLLNMWKKDFGVE